MTGIVGNTGFDFDEHEGSPVERARIDGNEVDFAEAAAGAALDDLVAEPLQIAGGGRFAVLAESLGAPPSLEPVAQ